MKVCPICGFETENAKVYANHIRWKHKTDKDSEKYHNFLDKCTHTEERISKTCICPRCGKAFEQEHTLREWDNGKNVRKFCSDKCAHKRGPQSEEAKRKISSSLKKEPKVYICQFCGKEFSSKKKGAKYCSKECGYKAREKEKDSSLFEDYASLCKFNFNIGDFTDEFDFELIKEYGWYAPDNSTKPNPGGVSRDHMVSRSYGFEHNIPPEVISHPANCKLVRQTENSSKGTNCSISVEELMERINLWENKYK